MRVLIHSVLLCIQYAIAVFFQSRKNTLQTFTESKKNPELIFYCVRMSAIGDAVLALNAFNELKKCVAGANELLGRTDEAFFVTDVNLIPALSIFSNPHSFLNSNDINNSKSSIQKNAIIVDFQNTSRSRKKIFQLLENHKRACVFLPQKNSLQRILLLIKARLKSFQQVQELNKLLKQSVEKNQFAQVQKALLKIYGAKLLEEIVQNEKHASPKEFTDLQTKSDIESEVKKVSLFIGSSGKLKLWPKENWRELLSLIFERTSWSVQLVGGKEDTIVADYLLFGVSENLSKRIRNYVGNSSLHSSFQVLLDSQLIVTGDSFASHVARHKQIPTVLLFGSTSPEFGFVPENGNLKLQYKNLSCSPCSKHGKGECRFSNLNCLRTMSANEVFGDCCELLAI